MTPESDARARTYYFDTDDMNAFLMAMANRLASDSSVSAQSYEQEHPDEVFSEREITRASSFLPSVRSNSPQDNQQLETFSRETKYMNILSQKERADASVIARDYENARIQYRDVLVMALEGRIPLAHNFYNEGYIELFRDELRKTHRFPMLLVLVSCCSSIANIYREREEYEKAIEWLEEVEVLYDCFKKVYTTYHPAFKKMHRTLEFVTYHMLASLQLVQIFTRLRNTSAVAYHAYLCNKRYPRSYPQDIQEIREIQQKCYAEAHFTPSHPDPRYVSTWDVEYPSLQVRGIWSKLSPRSSARPTKRQPRLSWIWRNNIYVAFGKHHKYHERDLDAWCIDLNGERSWRRLPNIPKRYRRLGAYAAKAVIFEDHAWFFSGRLDILRFDMVAEVWDVAETSADSALPYRGEYQYDSYVEIFGERLFVFGGYRDLLIYGDPAFLSLDLKTLKWVDLYKSLTPQEIADMPSPRTKSITWLSKTEGRFFFMYGEGIEKASSRSSRTAPAPKSINLYELWSYSILEKAWTRERLRGNFPCHRKYPICAYHERQDSFILFGGYTEDVPSKSLYSRGGQENDLKYSILADTFVLDLKTRTWRQVVTREFPAWRSNSALLIDDSGDIYLHGGVSSRSVHLGEPGEEINYCLTDIWRLDIGFPDSPVDEQSFITPTSSFKAGCWRRCRVCKSIGTGYLQCQGSCRGKHVYCSVACYRSSWETHRTSNGCGMRDDNGVE